MAKFVTCINRNACTEDGTHCRACGRSHEEIQSTRELTSLVADFVKRMNYENPQDFLAYLQRKVEKKIQ
jgi:hypothetical protein